MKYAFKQSRWTQFRKGVHVVVLVNKFKLKGALMEMNRLANAAGIKTVPKQDGLE